MGSDSLGKVVLKWEVANYNKKGSFWWRDNLKNLQTFKQMAQVQIKNGATCLFWKDNWDNIAWK